MNQFELGAKFHSFSINWNKNRIFLIFFFYNNNIKLQVFFLGGLNLKF